MKVKGYSYSGEPPNPNCSKDGKSITVIGYNWIPEIDMYGLNTPPIHFGNKLRGKLDPATEFFGKGGKMMSMEEFVPKDVTRRKVTKVFCRVYDPLRKTGCVHVQAEVAPQDNC